MDNNIGLSKLDIMDVILDEEKEQIKKFIKHSGPDEIYDRIYTICAFDIAYELLKSKLFHNEDTAEKIAAHPNIMTTIIETFDEDEEKELTPEYINNLILDILDSMDE
jgi:hypothetical protein